MRPRSNRGQPDEGAPVLLFLFFVATFAVIGAVVLISQTRSDWADAGTVALVLVLVALIGAVLARQLRD
jgi:uncharacterized membrane protein YfcA